MKPKRVAIIGANWPAYEKHCPNFVGMQMGLEEMGIEHRLFSCRPTLNPTEVINWEPDLIIYGLIDLVRHAEWRREIRYALPNTKIVMWYGDYRNNLTRQIQADMSEIDVMFVSNAQQNAYYEDMWKVPECHFLPLGSPVWNPEIQKKFELPFIFVGSTLSGPGYIDRAKTIWDFEDAGLRVIDAPAQTNPLLREKILKNLPSLYRSAKISLDYSHYTDIEGYTSNRFWIISGAGGFPLTKRFPGCEEFYPEDTRVYFDTIKEALSHRDYYLKNPEKREAVRLAGHIHAKNHTYKNRFAIMFETIYGKNT